MLRQVNYEFDAAGNIIKSIFHWTPNPSVDTLTFQYDSKINPIPAGPLLFFFAPIFYNEYKSTNNLIRALANSASSHNYYDYNSTPNNKTLYRKEQEIGSMVLAETYYYYD